MKKHVLVTGAAGFIGFHVVQALCKRGDFVCGLDNFNDYYPSSLKRARAKQLSIPLIEADINDREKLTSLFESHDITHVVHLAAQAGVRHARKHPEAYLKSNIDGFLSILETLRLFPHVKLLYASSSSVYGQNTKTPFSIADTTDKPANLYAATKKANELMGESYHHLYGIEMTALRYFTVYGPWGRPDMAYYHFTNRILNGEPLHLFNQGKMARDFTYIDDAIAGTLAALDMIHGHRVYNIGNNRPESLMHLVELLERYLKRPATKIFEPASPGEVETTFADITASTVELGYFPQSTLETGLSRFIDWYRSFHT